MNYTLKFEQAEQRFEVGLTEVTDVHEARADPLNEDAENNLIFARRSTIDNIEELPKSVFQKLDEAFVKKLSAEGLQPKSFYRAKNKYNYVYLKRYDSMQEARNARDSKYGGRYDGKTWIYRVIGK